VLYQATVAANRSTGNAPIDTSETSNYNCMYVIRVV